MADGSRRKFLVAAGTLVAAAVTSPLHGLASKEKGDWLEVQPQSTFTSLYQFTPQMLQKLVNSTFKATDDQGNMMVFRLLAVTDLRKQNTKSKTAFAMRFTQIQGKAHPQGTYLFSHPQLGSFQLFVVPGKGSKSTTYTAIINNL